MTTPDPKHLERAKALDFWRPGRCDHQIEGDSAGCDQCLASLIADVEREALPQYITALKEAQEHVKQLQMTLSLDTDLIRDRDARIRELEGQVERQLEHLFVQFAR